MPLKTAAPRAPVAKPLTQAARLKKALDCSFEFVRSQPLNGDLSPDTLVFTLPLTPLSINTRLHWRTESAIKARYKAHFETLNRAGHFPPVPAAPWPKASIRAVIHGKRAIDHDNSLSKCKLAQDLIVRAGYILDDNPKCLTWEGIPTQIVDGKAPAFLVLILTRIGEEL